MLIFILLFLQFTYFNITISAFSPTGLPQSPPDTFPAYNRCTSCQGEFFEIFYPFIFFKNPVRWVLFHAQTYFSEIADRKCLKGIWPSWQNCAMIIKDPAASNGVSNLQRSRAAGYLTLAAVAKCLACRLARCSRE